MSWVFTQTENPSFRFTAHNDPSIAEFKRAKQLVLTTMNHIHEQTGLKLAASLQYVGLTGKRMAGGNVVIEDGKLYVSAQADLTEVERKLIMLCK